MFRFDFTKVSADEVRVVDTKGILPTFSMVRDLNDEASVEVEDDLLFKDIILGHGKDGVVLLQLVLDDDEYLFTFLVTDGVAVSIKCTTVVTYKCGMSWPEHNYLKTIMVEGILNAGVYYVDGGVQDCLCAVRDVVMRSVVDAADDTLPEPPAFIVVDPNESALISIVFEYPSRAANALRRHPGVAEFIVEGITAGMVSGTIKVLEEDVWAVIDDMDAFISTL